MTLGKCGRCGFQNFVTALSCSKCGTELEHPENKNPKFFARLRSSLTKRGLKKEESNELRRLLRRIIGDGQVEETELSEIQAFYMKTALSREEFEIVRDEIFAWYVDLLLKDQRVTEKEKTAILLVGDRLGISQTVLNDVLQTTRYFELLQTIEASPFENLPVAGSSRVILRKGELDYFTANGSLLEERVIKREMVGRSHGISIPTPIKGVRYRVGQSRGKMVSERDIVPISFGEFTITNQRLVFSGDKKSVNAELSKLQDLEFFSNGLRFSLTNRQLPITVQLEDSRCAEVCRLYISRILNG